MYHSINFGDKNTWDEWRLVPTSRPVFNPPAQKVKTLDIPGSDGVIDLSTSLTGYPVFQNRTGSFEFIVVDYKYWTPMRDNINDTVRDYVNDDIKGAGFRQWYETYSDIMNYLHGRTMRAVLEDDPDYYYEGRFTVNSWKSEKNWSKITIDYDVGPYKWSVKTSSEENTIFDNFSIDPINIGTEDDPAWSIPKFYITSSLFGNAPISPKFIVNGRMNSPIYIEYGNDNLDFAEIKTIEPSIIPTNQIVAQFPELIFAGNRYPGEYISIDCGSTRGLTMSIDFRRGVL